MNVYYAPEKFGLKTVGEVDFSSGSYEFDLTVVWRREDGSLVYADDSGCSCPSPFENTGVDDLTPCTPGELSTHLANRQREASWYDREVDVTRLMELVIGGES